MDARLFKLKCKVPVNALSEVGFNQIAKFCQFRSFRNDDIIFRVGDTDRYSTFLIEGRVSLIDRDGIQSEIHGFSDRARYPLGNLRPRQCTAIARSPRVAIARIDARQLDRVVTLDQAVSATTPDSDLLEFSAPDDDVHWVRYILRSEEFAHIPPPNLQRLLMHLADVEVEEGEEIIHQGEEGDYFYLIRYGRCQVTRHAPFGEVELAELGPGDSFGESALASGLPRDASVRMLEKGRLKRLSKEHFRELLVPPLIPSVSPRDVPHLCPGGAVLLDVRTEDEFAGHSIKGSINIPFYLLRLRMKTLNHRLHYIVACDTGSRSAAATLLLNTHGFNAYLLEGGLNKAEHQGGQP